MKTVLCSLTLLLFGLYPLAATADLTPEELAAEPPPADATFDDYAHLVPEAPDGAISWSLLGSVDEVAEVVNGTSHIRPEFPDEIKALHGNKIRIKGFIYPMQNSEEMDEFLLTALPPSCPYCLPAGAGYLMETHTSKPLRFTWDAIVLEGTFEILENDPYGLYYRLDNARQVK